MKDVERALQTFYSMKLRDIMPSITSMPIVTVDSPIVDVLKLLRTRHHVWVVNNKDEMKLEGVIRYLDVMCILLPPENTKARLGNISAVFKSILGGAEKAADVMERNVMTIDEDATVLDALTRMRRYKVQILAIVDENNTLKGEISLRLLIDEFLRLMKVGGVQWLQSGSSSPSE
ncbi:CBS domain-containing protein [Thermococcus alcaliphilus]|uniref:CBS domain-containing protein n=1 Tax=Thermococcus alcaliphilus TaxID=139207 RepID=UPI0020904A67|nr:CBS domain-containing protein [Thermococcus alcaliphilus]MCO6042227.1 CBS domain-containing protein [Thermococcus alcaliphilus]